jgi:hypothetical protein
MPGDAGTTSDVPDAVSSALRVSSSIHLALAVPAIRDLIVVAAAFFALGLWPGPVRFTRALLEPTEADVRAVKMPRIAATPLLPPLEWDEELEASAARDAGRLHRLLERLDRAVPQSPRTRHV